MFLLYAVLIGLAIGFLLGGRFGRLAAMPLRWTWLIAAGLAVQVVLYSAPVSERVAQLHPALGPAVYVASMTMALVAVVRNVRIPGLALVALGAASNLAAIVANGGYMPVSPEALGNYVPGGGYSNSVTLRDPALAPLTDIFALPHWLPISNVFSVGDVLIGLGVAAAIVVQMRRVGPTEPPSTAIRTRPGDKPATGGHGGARCGPTTPPSGRLE